MAYVVTQGRQIKGTASNVVLGIFSTESKANTFRDKGTGRMTSHVSDTNLNGGDKGWFIHGSSFGAYLSRYPLIGSVADYTKAKAELKRLFFTRTDPDYSDILRWDKTDSYSFTSNRVSYTWAQVFLYSWVKPWTHFLLKHIVATNKTNQGEVDTLKGYVEKYKTEFETIGSSVWYRAANKTVWFGNVSGALVYVTNASTGGYGASLGSTRIYQNGNEVVTVDKWRMFSEAVSVLGAP